MPPLACGLAPIRRSPVGRQRARARAAACRPRRTAPRVGSERIHASSCRRCSGLSASPASGTWCARNVPSTGTPSTSFGPVQPFGVRRTIIGQRGRSVVLAAAGALLDGGDLVERVVQRRGHRLVHLGGVVALDEARLVPVALAAGACSSSSRDAREHRRVGDLVAVEVQDRQHRAVARRVQELVECQLAASGPGLRLAVADDAADDQVRGCRTPRRRRARARSRARRPRGSSRASPARRGSGSRRGRRTGGTAGACPRRRVEMSG